MNLGQLGPAALRRQLQSDGVAVEIGPFAIRISSHIRAIADGLECLYADYPLAEPGRFVDYAVTIATRGGVRRFFRPQCVFNFEGTEPFIPLPLDHAFPLLEWSMNWCISMHCYQYLLLHAAVIERHGCAVIMPAPPGSGKSTLCAGLVHRGWRLLSDELALISLEDASITGLGRPISLKNESIEVIRSYVNGAVFNRITHDTSKGSVTHLKVPAQQLARIHEKALPRWVVFPKYAAGSTAQLVPRSKASSMLELGRNSFNYMVLGLVGFETLGKVIDHSACFDFQYSKLDDAVKAFDDMATRTSG